MKCKGVLDSQKVRSIKVQAKKQAVGATKKETKQTGK